MARIIQAGIVAIVALGSGNFALAADMPLKAPPAPVVTPSYNWNGFYVGGHLGYGWQSVDTTVFDSTGALTTSDSFNRKGWLGGGQAGFNWMVGPSFLLGIEADFSGADIKGTNSACTATGCASSNSKFDELATVRGRLGYAMNSVLFYGTGGWAWSRSSTNRTVTCVVAGGGVCPGGPSPSALTGQVANASGNQGGWSAGGGIEWGFAPNWTAKVEYLHYEFDKVGRDFTYPAFPTAFRHIDSNNSMDTIRIGVNYLFHYN
jgi:outer membrane immunogenic protein